MERRNRTVEEKISNWMHENNSTHWASSLPFIQWRCNTQQHKGIGNRTPYHLTFGQNPLVGISNLPISHHLLSSLRTESDVSNALGLTQDVPVDEAILGNLSSPGTQNSKTTHLQKKKKDTSSQKKKKKKDTSSQLSNDTRPLFRRTPDLIERLVANILPKCIVKPPGGGTPYFGWKGFGFQCGVCFNAVPSNVNFLTGVSLLMMVDNREAPRKDSSLLLTDGRSPDLTSTETQRGDGKKDTTKSRDESTETQRGGEKGSKKWPTEEKQGITRSNSCGSLEGEKPFVFSAYNEDSSTDQKMGADQNMGEYSGRHRWLNILSRVREPITAVQLSNAKLRSCFAIVDKPTNSLSSPWRRVIIRKITKREWEVLDEYGESVLDTVTDDGIDEGPVAEWGVWYRHPTVNDYEEALVINYNEITAHREKALLLDESPNRKQLRDEAYDALTTQAKRMKVKAQNYGDKQLDVGTIVQVPLADVDTTKADGKNLTLIIVDKVHQKGSGPTMYRLACKSGVLSRLYHPSYITTVAADPKILGLESVLDEWTGLPRMTEREAARTVSLVGGQGKHLGCKCKRSTCQTKRCSCFQNGMKCSSSCHGVAGNKFCVNHS